MNKNLQDIDRLFIQFLENHKEEPPKNGWQAIENELNRIDAQKYKTRYNFLRTTLICIVLTGSFLLLSYVLQLSVPNLLKKEVNAVNSNKSEINTASNSIHPNKLPAISKVSENVSHQAESFFKETTNADVLQPPDVLAYFNKNEEQIVAIRKLNYNNLSAGNSFNFNNYINNNSLLHLSIDKYSTDLKQDRVTQKRPLFLSPYLSFDHFTGRYQKEYEYGGNQPDFEKYEKLDLSYTAGLLFEYELSKKISLQSGLLYSHWFTAVSPAVVEALQDNSGTYKFKLATNYGLAEIKQSGIATPQSGDSIRVNDGFLNLQSVSIPLILKANVKPGKFSISGMAGVAINRITRDVAELEYTAGSNIDVEKETVQKIDGLRKNYFTVIAGAEATYPLSKRINIGLNPVMRYAITPINKGTPVKTFPINIGAGVSLRIKL